MRKEILSENKEKCGMVIIFIFLFLSFFLGDFGNISEAWERSSQKVIYVHNSETIEKEVEKLANRAVGEGKIKKLTFSKTNTTALHLIVFKEGGAEKYHFHRESDLFAIVLKGKGTILIEGKNFELKKGDQVFIPKGKKHRFINKEKGDTWVLVISSPPLKKEDRHFVK